VIVSQRDRHLGGKRLIFFKIFHGLFVRRAVASA